MRHATVIALLAVIAACSGVAVRDFAQVNEVYTTTLQGLALSRQAGKIDDDTYRKIDPFVQAGDAALDSIWTEIKRALDAGEKPEIAQVLFTDLNGNLDQLILWGLRIAGAVEDPTVLNTRPVMTISLEEIEKAKRLTAQWARMAPEAN